MPPLIRKDLFKCDGKPMIFDIIKCRDREELQTYIESGGGRIQNEDEDDSFTITLLSPGGVAEEAGCASDAFSSEFILKCIINNEILPLKKFWLKTSGRLHDNFDPNCILEQKLSWLDASKQCSGIHIEEYSYKPSRQNGHITINNLSPVIKVSRCDDRVAKSMTQADQPESDPAEPQSDTSDEDIRVAKTTTQAAQPKSDPAEPQNETSDEDISIECVRNNISAIGRKRRGRQEYTQAERKKIVNYIVDNNCYHELKGALLWRQMSKHVPRHTWQSLKEHFKKKIMPSISEYNLAPVVIDRFKSAMGPTIVVKERAVSSSDEEIQQQHASRASKRTKHFSESSSETSDSLRTGKTRSKRSCVSKPGEESIIVVSSHSDQEGNSTSSDDILVDSDDQLMNESEAEKKTVSWEWVEDNVPDVLDVEERSPVRVEHQSSSGNVNCLSLDDPDSNNESESPNASLLPKWPSNFAAESLEYVEDSSGEDQDEEGNPAGNASGSSGELSVWSHDGQMDRRNDQRERSVSCRRQLLALEPHTATGSSQTIVPASSSTPSVCQTTDEEDGCRSPVRASLQPLLSQSGCGSPTTKVASNTHSKTSKRTADFCAQSENPVVCDAGMQTDFVYVYPIPVSQQNSTNRSHSSPETPPSSLSKDNVCQVDLSPTNSSRQTRSTAKLGSPTSALASNKSSEVDKSVQSSQKRILSSATEIFSVESETQRSDKADDSSPKTEGRRSAKRAHSLYESYETRETEESTEHIIAVLPSIETASIFIENLPPTNSTGITPSKAVGKKAVYHNQTKATSLLSGTGKTATSGGSISSLNAECSSSPGPSSKGSVRDLSVSPSTPDRLTRNMARNQKIQTRSAQKST